jgi:hypothetical protein
MCDQNTFVLHCQHTGYVLEGVPLDCEDASFKYNTPAQQLDWLKALPNAPQYVVDLRVSILATILINCILNSTYVPDH